jgi:hypothetical protein
VTAPTFALVTPLLELTPSAVLAAGAALTALSTSGTSYSTRKRRQAGLSRWPSYQEAALPFDRVFPCCSSSEGRGDTARRFWRWGLLKCAACLGVGFLIVYSHDGDMADHCELGCSIDPLDHALDQFDVPIHELNITRDCDTAGEWADCVGGLLDLSLSDGIVPEGCSNFITGAGGYHCRHRPLRKRADLGVRDIR